MIISPEAQAHYETGKKLFEEKKYEEACTEYAAAIIDDPNYIEAHIDYINALIGSKNNIRALAECEQTLAILDKDLGNENHKFRFEIYALWGFALSNIGNYLLAIEKCQESIKLYDTYLNHDIKEYIVANSIYTLPLYYMGKYNETIEVCKKIISLNPQEDSLINTLIIYGHALNNLHRYDEATTQYKEAINLSGNSISKAVPLFAYGAALFHQEKYNEALIKFEKALEYENQQENKPNLADIYRNLGYTLLALNKYNEAIEKFNKIIKIDSAKQKDALFGIADVYLKQKDLDKFNETYDKIFDIARGNINAINFFLHPIKTIYQIYIAIKQILSNDPLIMYIGTLRGDKLYAHGSYHRATQSYKSTSYDIELVKFISIFIRKKEDKEEVAKKIQFYKFLLNPQYFFMVGNICYTFFANLKDAEYMYLKGLELNERNIEILINLGHLYQEKHKNSSDGNQYYWKAQNILNKVKNILEETLISNNNTDILNQLGRVYILLKNYDKAEEYITQAYQKNRKNSLSAMGLIYLYKKEFYASIKYYKEILEIEPENINALINLASIYFQQNEYEDSEIRYKQVLSIAPRNVEAHLGLGEIYINLGSQHNESKYYSQALWYFNKAIKISHSNNKSKKLNDLELASIHYFIGYAKLKLYLIANNARSFWKLKSAQYSFIKCLKYDKSNSQAHLMVKNISERLLPLYRDYGIAALFIIFAISFSWGIYLFNLDKEKDIIIWLVPIALAALGLYFPSITKFKVGDIEIEKTPIKESTSIFSGVDIEKVSLEKEKMIIPTPPLNIIK